MIGLLWNWRFLAGVAGGVVANQELGNDKIRFYIDNPATAYKDLSAEIKQFLK